MKRILRIALVTLYFTISFNAESQKHYSFEFEVAPLLSNRFFTQQTSGYAYGQIDKHRSQSKFMPGFHFQAGINLREDKRTRFFAGIKLLNQNVLLGQYSFYNTYVDGNGELVLDGSASSTPTDMIYLTFPLMIKQTWISKSDFRMVSEIGVAPGFFLHKYPSFGPHDVTRSLFGEFALSYEWKLEKGNMIGIKFPAFTYSFLPNKVMYKNIKQYNYSVSLGLKFGIAKSIAQDKSVRKKQYTNISFETEITALFSDIILSFGKSLPSNSADYDYYLNQFEEFRQAPSQFLPGASFQFGFNFRDTKRTRLFCGTRFTIQNITSPYVANHYYGAFDSSGYFVILGVDYTEYLLRPMRMTYLSIPVFLKQSIVSKANFRFGCELGATPGIQFYEDNFPWASKKNHVNGSIQAELSLSFEKKLKNGDWIGVKLPSFNYSLLTNITRYEISQRNYSIGMGIRYTFQD